VTLERAIDIFNDMTSHSCVACNPSSTCIPFLYFQPTLFLHCENASSILNLYFVKQLISQ
jgi:hypothetical protein